MKSLLLAAPLLKIFELLRKGFNGSVGLITRRRRVNVDNWAMQSGVFISHIAEDKYAGIALKELLRAVFGNDLDVFLSSDYESIRSGVDWHGAIIAGLNRSTVVLVLCHEASVTREWINYEAGVGDGQASLVVPCVIRGFSKGALKPPISRKQARSLTDAEDMKALTRDIAEHVSCQAKEVDFAGFMEAVGGLSALTPHISVAVVPFIARSVGSNDQIRFELQNSGTTDVELIQLKVMVPDRILDGSWPRSSIPPILSFESINHTREAHTVGTYVVTDQPIARGYQPNSPRLPRYLAGKDVVTLAALRLPLVRTLTGGHETAVIRSELALHGAPLIKQEVSLREMLNGHIRES